MTQERRVIHVDMDAFYASVEQLDHPELAGKCVIVGGDPAGRGVVSAASYEARRFGVHSAMPMARAVRLCPQAVILPVRMGRYVELSHKIREIFRRYTPLIEPISLDEAFLDVTGSMALFGSAERIGRDIKQTIGDELHLVASIGVAPNKFLAKLASDLDKPDGFVVITEANRQAVLDPLGIAKIWGVGKVTADRLCAAGITTIGRLRTSSVERLQSLVGNQAEHLRQLAHGRDDRPVEGAAAAKSISSEKTFAQDIADIEVLEGVLLAQVEEVAARLRRAELNCKTITLKLRDGAFKTITRSSTLGEPTNVTDVLWGQAKTVFTKWRETSFVPLRLLGLAATGLVSGPVQGRLFPDPPQVQGARIDQALDAIAEKYGKSAVRRGRSKPR